jgi:phage shock protein C
MEPKQLRRSNTNKVIAGVCGGLGEYFDIDPSIVRILFVLFTFFGGSGFLLYIVMWLVMPVDESKPLTKEGISNTVDEMKDRANEVMSNIRSRDTSKDNSWIAFLLLAIGILFLFRNFGVLQIFNVDRAWPLVLVVIGIVLLYKKR